MALLLCQEAKTLTGLLRQIVVRVTLSGLSRFLAKAPCHKPSVRRLEQVTQPTSSSTP